MAELGWGFISRRRMGACCQLPRHHKVCDTKTLTAGLTAPRKGGERNTSANFERTIQTLTMFLLGTGGSPPPLPPDCQLCQSTLGIVRDLGFFGGVDHPAVRSCWSGIGSTMYNRFLRIWDCFTMGKPSLDTLERSRRAPRPGLV